MSGLLAPFALVRTQLSDIRSGFRFQTISYSVEGPDPDLFISPSSTNLFRLRLAVRSSALICRAYALAFVLPVVASHSQPRVSDSLKVLRTSGGTLNAAASDVRKIVSFR